MTTRTRWTRPSTPLPQMYPRALEQVVLLLIMAKNRAGGLLPFTTDPADLCGDMLTGNEGRIAQILDDENWRGVIARELSKTVGAVTLVWDGEVLVVGRGKGEG